jgi:hypothetical protein
VVELWRQREQDSLAAERVEEIMANARAGRTLEAIAADSVTRSSCAASSRCGAPQTVLLPV